MFMKEDRFQAPKIMVSASRAFTLIELLVVIAIIAILAAAIGWLGLGNWREANEELEN